MPALVTCTDEDPFKNEGATVFTPFTHNNSIWIFFVAQGRVTLKLIVESKRNSNSSESLCLSRLHTGLTNIQ